MSEFIDKLRNSDAINSISVEVDMDRACAGNVLVAVENEFKDWQPPKTLVVVPKFFADAIESIPPYYSAYGAIKLIDMKITEFPLENEDWKYVHDWIFVDDNANKFAKALIDGYTVEKENLYILKHIDMSKLYTDVSLYLAHGLYKELEHIFYKDVNVHNVEQCHFTQKEIDKLNIGSYEQIEVNP